MTNQINEETLSKARDAVADALGDVLYCSRDWSAWSYGTMSQDDFSLAWQDDEFVEGVVQAVLATFTPDTVNSIEELESLPAGAIIRPNGRHIISVIIRDQMGTWAIAGHPKPYSTKQIYLGLHDLGATVLCRPEGTND